MPIRGVQHPTWNRLIKLSGVTKASLLLALVNSTQLFIRDGSGCNEAIVVFSRKASRRLWLINPPRHHCFYPSNPVWVSSTISTLSWRFSKVFFQATMFELSRMKPCSGAVVIAKPLNYLPLRNSNELLLVVWTDTYLTIVFLDNYSHCQPGTPILSR